MRIQHRSIHIDLLMGLAVGTEILGSTALWVEMPGSTGWVFPVFHGLASLCFAPAAWAILPERYRSRPAWAGLLLFGLLAFALPFVGMFGLTAVALSALCRPNVTGSRTWQRVTIPPLPAHPTSPDPERGSIPRGAYLVGILEQTQSDVEQRTAAVMALRQLPTQAALPALRVALRDPEDDVRLLAYSMLARRDHEIQSLILQDESALRQLLENPSADPANKVGRYRSLASLYWELVHSNLATGAMERRALERASMYAQDALGIENDRATLFLLGRILFRQGALSEAETVLLKARAAGFSGAAIAPFLAEIAFRLGRLDQIRNHFASSDRATGVYPEPMNQVRRYWLTESI